jgi:hypothetical protein
MLKKWTVLPVLFLLPSLCLSQRLEPFASTTKSADGYSGKRVYPQVCSYFECVEGGDNPFIAKNNNQEVYSLYFYIPDTLTEIAARALSPVPELVSPDKGMIATESFYNCPGNLKAGFDIAISLFRSTATTFNSGSLEWSLVAENDNSAEMQHESDACLRVVSKANTGSLLPGIYRIDIRSTKPSLRGNFLLQIGSFPGVRRLQLYAHPENIPH